MQLIDVINAPWAIMPEKLDEIRSIYEAHVRNEALDLEAVEAKLGRPLANSAPREYSIESGVAVIPVSGVIAPKANLLTRVSGGTSAQVLARMVSDAAADPAARAIVLSIDSGGGSVFGVPEAAAAVRAAADAKPVVAWTDGTMASGAYWIASAADSIWMSSEVSIVGSIGVVATHVDVSQREAALGVKTTEVAAGTYKRITSQYQPLTPEGRAVLQAQVDEIYRVFVDTVASNRSVDSQTVVDKMADGRVFVGRQAIDAGLVDGVKAFDVLVSELSSGNLAAKRTKQAPVAAAGVQPPISEKGKSMSEPALKPITVEVIKAEHPAVAEALVNEGRQAGLVAGAQAERERVAAIDAQALPGFEKIVADAKADGKSTGADVAMAIVQAQRAQGAAALNAMRQGAPEPAKPAPAPAEGKPAAGAAEAAGPDAHETAQKAQAYQAEQLAKGIRVSAADAVAHVSARA